MALDLTAPSGDTPTLARQWLAVLKSDSDLPDGFFKDNEYKAADQFVEHVASMVGHGTRYFKKGDVTPSMLRLARKLGRAALSEIFAKSLQTGEPEYAKSIGVTDSESIVASTGPKS